MSQECPYCGSEMSELDAFCTKCGLGTQAYAPIDKQQSRKRSKKFRWWMIPLVLVLLCALIMILLWSKLSLYMAPELQLAEAISSTASDLAGRLQGSPLGVLADSSQWEDGYTTAVNLDLSIVGYDGFSTTVISTVNPNSSCFSLSYQQSVFGNSSVHTTYADKNHVVFVRETADGPEAYSVVFDDLDQVLDSGIFSGIKEDYLETFSGSVEGLRVPASSFKREDINKRYTEVLVDMLKDSSRSVSYEKRMLEGKNRQCGMVSYSLNNFVLAKGLEALADVAQDDISLHGYYHSTREISHLDLTQQGKEEDSEDIPSKLRQKAQELKQDREGGITVIFHLCEKKLVRLCLERQAHGVTEFSVDAEFGMDLSSGDILVVIKDKDGQKNILLQTEKNGQSHSDTLSVSSQEGVESISWNWNKATGELPITVLKHSGESSIQAVLNETEDGFMLEFSDALSVLDQDVMIGMGLIQSFTQLDLNIHVTKGADVQIPEGKPIEEWTESDLKSVMKDFLK